MHLFNETIKNILPADLACAAHVRARLQKALPQKDSLGVLENILCRYVAITGQTAPKIPQKCTIIACADHGVAEMKISAYPPETTVQMTRNYLISKGAVANALANFSGSDMHVVDMGIAASTDEIPGLIRRKIAFGTKNCAKEAAMTRAQAIQAIETGIELANAYAAQGYCCFLPGEMGIANTTSSAAIIAALCGLTPEKATGRGTNISDERLRVKIEIVRQVLKVNRPDPTDGVDVLAKVGGFELGCITGLILGAAANRAFVVLDGFNTGAAALIAAAIHPLAKEYLMGSHLAAEPAHLQTLQALEIAPYMDMHFRLGEATGSSIAVNLLDAAVRIFARLTNQTPPEMSVEEIAPPARPSINKPPDNFCPPNQAAMEKCRFYIDNLTKPIHSLGALEALAVQIAGVTGQERPTPPQKLLFTFTAGGASADWNLTCALAAHAGARIAHMPLPQTADSAASVACGIECSRQASRRGQKLLGFCHASASDARAAASALKELSAPAPSNPLALLSALQNNSLSAMTGVIIGAAQYGCVVVLDGPLSQAAALIAVRIQSAARAHLIVPEYAAAGEAILRAGLNLPSYLMLNIRQAGAVSALGMKLVDAAMHMLHDMKTFEDAAVAVAGDGPGANRQIAGK